MQRISYSNFCKVISADASDKLKKKSPRERFLSAESVQVYCGVQVNSRCVSQLSKPFAPETPTTCERNTAAFGRLCKAKHIHLGAHHRTHLRRVIQVFTFKFFFFFFRWKSSSVEQKSKSHDSCPAARKVPEALCQNTRTCGQLPWRLGR